MNTCAKFLSPARRLISAFEASGFSYGTTTEALSRFSREVHFSSCCSFAANAIAAENSGFWSPCAVGCSGFRMP